MFERAFHAEGDGARGEQATLHAHGFGERFAVIFHRRMHDAEQRAPIDEPAAGELAGKPIANANVVGAHEYVAHFIEPAPAGAAEHLEDFIAAQCGLHTEPAASATLRREKLMPAARPMVATTTRSWPALVSGSMTPARAA